MECLYSILVNSILSKLSHWLFLCDENGAFQNSDWILCLKQLEVDSIIFWYINIHTWIKQINIIFESVIPNLTVIYFVSFTHTARYELLLRHVYKIIKKWFLLEKGHFITWMSNLLCIIVYNNFFLVYCPSSSQV